MKRALVVGLCSGAALSSTFAQELYDSLEPIENVVRMRINRDGSVTEVAGGPSFRANSSYYDCTGADYRLTGSVPRWHPNGKELFYVRPDRTLMSVSVTPSGVKDTQFGKPSVKFQSPAFAGDADYDVLSNGQFVLNVPVAANSLPVRVIYNWIETVKNRPRP